MFDYHRTISAGLCAVEGDGDIPSAPAGLAKKLLIADPIGAVADQVFAHQPDRLTSALAWTGVLAFSLQIYFDFSGFGDMSDHPPIPDVAAHR